MLRQAISHTKPRIPGITKAGRHAQREYTEKKINGAIAPPTDDPLSNSAVAKPRSRFGNHSDTAFVAPGQLADSPSPSRKRNAAKPLKPLARDVKIETSEYHNTERLNPRLVPTRSTSLPQRVWPRL